MIGKTRNTVFFTLDLPFLFTTVSLITTFFRGIKYPPFLWCKTILLIASVTVKDNKILGQVLYLVEKGEAFNQRRRPLERHDQG